MQPIGLARRALYKRRVVIQADGMTKQRVLVIGLDAFDRTIADELIQVGRLPNLDRIMTEGTVADVQNPYGLLTGPVWPTLASGTGPTSHQNWTWRQLVPGTYRKRFRGPNAPSLTRPFWAELARKGVSFVTVDVPRVCLIDDSVTRQRGRQIVGLRQHDLRDPDEFVTCPPELRAELIDRFDVLDDRCDSLRAAGRLGDLAEILNKGIDEKVSLLDELFADEHPDLAFVVFPESHCAGHQFFGLHLASVGGLESVELDHFGDLLAETYERLDAAIGRIIASHGTEETNVAVVMSHGMADVIPISHLLPSVLEAIDDAMGRASLRARARAFVERTPNRIARALLRAIRGDIEQLDHWVDSSRRFFSISVFPTYGAVRLNLEGREPRGRVSAAERTSTLARLEQELLELRDIDTGEPLIKVVERSEAHYSVEPDVGLPDVMFEWAISDRIVRGARSATLGEIISEPERYRPGNHLRDGRVVFWGPSFGFGRHEPIRAEDVAPTIAACLGHELDDVDGRSIIDPSQTRSSNRS
ncbi:MAG: putative AlkP superfamily phosphohydrolase/phosphomutase [Myxococcota bacterium]|jgi:predicted AlkP superfamily phosphohydrolase/phosphomutase